VQASTWSLPPFAGRLLAPDVLAAVLATLRLAADSRLTAEGYKAMDERRAIKTLLRP
jgi:hypothetical protein